MLWLEMWTWYWKRSLRSCIMLSSKAKFAAQCSTDLIINLREKYAFTDPQIKIQQTLMN